MNNTTETKKEITFKSVINVLKVAFQGFGDDRITKLSASLSYATIFSIPPFFIILITIGSYFWGQQATEGQLFGRLQEMFGAQLAENIQNIIKNATIADTNFWTKAVGVIVVILGASSIFAEIQDSLNLIWGIRPKPKRGWLQMIRNRVLSFSIVLSVAFLLLVSFFVTYLVQILNTRLVSSYPDVAAFIFSAITFILNVVITCFLFALIFKTLPDAKIKITDVLTGAFATTILFLTGQKLISIYMAYSPPGTAYGAAAFVVIILLWVYYSSIILYFGAEFTKAWAIEVGNNIYPAEYAVSTKIIEVEQHPEKPLESLNKTQIDTSTTEGQKEAEQTTITEKAEEEIKVEDKKESEDEPVSSK